MPLAAVHLQAQHGQAQACSRAQNPCVSQLYPVCPGDFIERL